MQAEHPWDNAMSRATATPGIISKPNSMGTLLVESTSQLGLKTSLRRLVEVLRCTSIGVWIMDSISTALSGNRPKKLKQSSKTDIDMVGSKRFSEKYILKESL